VAGCPAMCRALANAKLIQWGYHSLDERYQALASG
jgi:hypothetical protein